MSIQTINPFTNNIIQDYPEMSSAEVSQIIETAHDAHLSWRKVSLSERAAKLNDVILVLNKNKQQYAELITQEMGKPITQALAEIDKCVWITEYYRDNIVELLKPKLVKTEAIKSYVANQATGTIFAIMPWNYPFWQVLRFAIPNITAGNAGLLSHAPICTGTALAIEDIFKQAGYPEGLFRSLVIDVPEAGNVITHDKVAGVTLTGSERAGSAVAEAAGKALKKVVLELGGSDPYLILEDADLELAAEKIVCSRMNNSGQVCISAKRILVVPSVHEKLRDLVLEKLKYYQYGDPNDPSTTMGPMARKDLRAELHQQVCDSVASGCELLLGGEMPEGPANFYPATVLDQVKKGSKAYEEELFGPVIAFIPVADTEEAIAVANGTRFGLGAAVFTQDLEKGEDIALNRIESGTCCVNDMVKSDPRLPFGGVKKSGIGREMAMEGLCEFLNIKTVVVN